MHLHIVSFNVPYPADYGGVIDVFYRIKSLCEAGVKVHLHCYHYGRKPAIELERYCVEVNYYQRETTCVHLLHKRPYIVDSRCSRKLLERLDADEYPILLEGLHCCWLLEELRKVKRPFNPDYHRLIIVRAHNVEHDYYSLLGNAEKRLWKKIYLKSEAKKLKKYEPVLLQSDAILAVTDADRDHFASIGCKEVLTMSTSHHHDTVSSSAGLGTYALYQADLSVPENIEAVKYLAFHIFKGSQHRLIVAGRNPSKSVVALVRKHRNINLVATPKDSYMDKLIGDAQVNIMVTNQPTGLKLKLIHALYCGRHCLVNPHMVAGTQLASLCHVADTAEEQKRTLDTLMSTPFTEQDINKRLHLLESTYSNKHNASLLVGLMKKLVKKNNC